MADEEFEIDIYGDAGGDQADTKGEANEHAFDTNNNVDLAPSGDVYVDGDHRDMQTDNHVGNDSSMKESKPQQGTKRKSDSDDRPIDPGATTALMISELNWWNTDDDIRGWVRQAHCEAELKDITFSEHKVNGKSKGQAYVEFLSQQAATAAKHSIDAAGEATAQPGGKRHTVIYASTSSNPFKTLPKDAPARGKQDGGNRSSGAPIFHGNDGGSGNRGNYGGGFRGRGSYNRGGNGGGMNQGGGYNRNFSGGNAAGGGSNNIGGGGPGFNGGSMNFGGSNMGNMNPMGGGNFGFGGGRGGGMMGGNMRAGPGGMRGNRGGGGGGGGGGQGGAGGMNMMGGMPMGGMGMGGMPGGMGGMNMMGAGMGGFNGMNPPFGGPAPFFGNAGGGGSGPNEWGNPHGAKRQRPE